MARSRKAKPAPAPVFDSHALIARLRAGDQAALDEAYRRVFGSDLGRWVLADMAAGAGVGQKYAGAPDLFSYGYHQGGHDLAIDFINRAGFDQPSAVSMVMTGQLEGRDDDESAGVYAEPDPVLPD